MSGFRSRSRIIVIKFIYTVFRIRGENESLNVSDNPSNNSVKFANINANEKELFNIHDEF